MNLSGLKDGLYQWVSGNVSRPTIWADQNSPRPAKPYFTLKITPVVQIGEDHVSSMLDVSGVDKYRITGDREFTLMVQGIGYGAIQKLSNLRDSLNDPVVTDALRSHDIAYVDSEDILDITELEDSIYVERGSLDVVFRTSTQSEIAASTERSVIESVYGSDTYKVGDQTVFTGTYEVTT